MSARVAPLLFLVASLVCRIPPIAQSQQPSPLHRHSVLFGTLRDASTKETLQYVNITDFETKSAAVTGTGGGYRLVLNPGPHSLQFTCIGYNAGRISVSVPEGDSLRVDMVLVSSALLFDEVTIIAERSPRSTIHGLGALSIQPGQVQNISGMFSDVYRTVQTMAGVASNNEMASQFSVRGGAIDDNLVLLNGAQLLEPFHLKESPNTSLSTVNVDLLKRVLFIPGGFTAQYGDRLSAVLDLEYREGTRERLAGQVDATLTSVAAILEGPLSSFGSGLISFRSTYSSYISHYLADGAKRTPSFYDVQGIIGTDAAEGHHLTASFLFASDRTSGLVDGSYRTTLLSIAGTHVLSRGTVLHSSLSSYLQNENLARNLVSIPTAENARTPDHSSVTLREARLRSDTQVNTFYSLTLGTDILEYEYNVEKRGYFALANRDSMSTAILSRNSYKIAMYAENHFQVNKSFLVNAGTRLDHSALTHEMKLGPRLLTAYRIGTGPILKAALGLYYQTPSYHELLAASFAGASPQGMQRAWHYVVGLEQPLQDILSLRVEAYLKDMDNLISFKRLRSGELIYSPRNDAEGRVHGIEFEMCLTDSRVMAWINVAYMVAKENNVYDGRGWQYRPSDQRKTVSTVFEYRIANRWVLNLRALYGSGYAYVNDSPGVERDTRLHYPDYKRADVRLSYAFKFEAITSVVFFEITNLFAHRNVYSFAGTLQDPQTPDYNLLLPMIINVGFRIRL